MPSRPSLARTVRKGAGTETRPFVSILLVNVDTNWSISPSCTLGPTSGLTSLECETLLSKSGGRGGADPPVACKERGQPPPLTHRTGSYGITWDLMGVNGKRWERGDHQRDSVAKVLHAALLLVNHVDCRSAVKRVTTRRDGLAFLRH